MSDLPKLGIVTADLIAEVERLLEEAKAESMTGSSAFGAVNWADLGISDIEYRLSVTDAKATPYCVVTVEEASPTSHLAGWLTSRLDPDRFPGVYVECEW
jgi:hypothetical protein